MSNHTLALLIIILEILGLGVVLGAPNTKVNWTRERKLIAAIRLVLLVFVIWLAINNL